MVKIGVPIWFRVLTIICLFNMVLVVGLSYIAFIVLKSGVSISNLLEL